MSVVPLPGRRQVMLLAIGGLSLASGSAFYAIVRPPPVARSVLPDAFLPALASLAAGPVSGAAPTFAHTLAFCLLTAAVLGPSARYGIVVCAAWPALEIGFELAQHDAVASWLLAHMPASLQPITIAYVTGTFDPADMLAAVLGGAAALCVLTASQRIPP
jgi:hypothetical protein